MVGVTEENRQSLGVVKETPNQNFRKGQKKKKKSPGALRVQRARSKHDCEREEVSEREQWHYTKVNVWLALLKHRLFCCGLQRNIAIHAGCCMQGTRSLKQKYVVQLPDKLSALRNQCRSHNLKAVVLIAVENSKPRQDSLLCLATVPLA